MGMNLKTTVLPESNYSGEIDTEITDLFPDTYEDGYGDIQPRIFIEENFVGKEVITSGKVEFDEDGELFSTVTVIRINEENSEENSEENGEENIDENNEEHSEENGNWFQTLIK